MMPLLKGLYRNVREERQPLRVLHEGIRGKSQKAGLSMKNSRQLGKDIHLHVRQPRSQLRGKIKGGILNHISNNFSGVYGQAH